MNYLQWRDLRGEFWTTQLISEERTQKLVSDEQIYECEDHAFDADFQGHKVFHPNDDAMAEQLLSIEL